MSIRKRHAKKTQAQKTQIGHTTTNTVIPRRNTRKRTESDIPRQTQTYQHITDVSDMSVLSVVSRGVRFGQKRLSTSVLSWFVVVRPCLSWFVELRPFSTDSSWFVLVSCVLSGIVRRLSQIWTPCVRSSKVSAGARVYTRVEPGSEHVAHVDSRLFILTSQSRSALHSRVRAHGARRERRITHSSNHASVSQHQHVTRQLFG